MNPETLDSGIILHELANISTMIQSGTHVLDGATPGSREAHIGKATLMHATRRLNDTLSSLRVLLGRSHELPVESRLCLRQMIMDYVGETLAWQGISRSVRVTADSDEAEVVIPDLLRLILRNFLANALKYSPANSPIDIRVRHSGADTRILFRNRGPKIADEIRAGLFEPGCKGPQGGAGIGLYIAQRAAQGMNGRIRFLSHRTQTAFSVIFPTRRQTGERAGFIAA